MTAVPFTNNSFRRRFDKELIEGLSTEKFVLQLNSNRATTNDRINIRPHAVGACCSNKQLTKGDNKMNSWEDVFAEFRMSLVSKMMPSFDPSGPARKRLRQIERSIRSNWSVGENIPAVETMPYGIALGDLIVEKCGARWEYGPFSQEALCIEHLVAHKVSIDGWSGYPFVRVGRFVADPSKNLMSFYESFSGQIDIDKLGADWNDIGSMSRMRRVTLDE